jgi:hypothetical protein
MMPAIRPRFAALPHSRNSDGTTRMPRASVAAESSALLVQTRKAKSCAGFSE